jgi:hypothetical protein
MNAHGMLIGLFHEPLGPEYTQLSYSHIPDQVQAILYNALTADLILSVCRIFDPIVTAGKYKNASLARLENIARCKGLGKKITGVIEQRGKDLRDYYDSHVDDWRSKLLAHTSLRHIQSPSHDFPEIDVHDLWDFLANIESHLHYLLRQLGVDVATYEKGWQGKEAARYINDIFYRHTVLAIVSHYLKARPDVKHAATISDLVAKPALWSQDPDLVDLISSAIDDDRVFRDEHQL